MTITVPATPEGFAKAAEKIGISQYTVEQLVGWDYTPLLVHLMRDDDPPDDEIEDISSARMDVQQGPIQEFDPRTGRIVVGLEEGSDVEYCDPKEYATKEEIEEYVDNWRVNLKDMGRIILEDYGIEVYVDELDGNYIIEYYTSEND